VTARASDSTIAVNCAHVISASIVLLYCIFNRVRQVAPTTQEQVSITSPVLKITKQVTVKFTMHTVQYGDNTQKD